MDSYYKVRFETIQTALYSIDLVSFWHQRWAPLFWRVGTKKAASEASRNVFVCSYVSLVTFWEHSSRKRWRKENCVQVFEHNLVYRPISLYPVCSKGSKGSKDGEHCSLSPHPSIVPCRPCLIVVRMLAQAHLITCILYITIVMSLVCYCEWIYYKKDGYRQRKVRQFQFF